jgi:hypothetical protein
MVLAGGYRCDFCFGQGFPKEFSGDTSKVESWVDRKLRNNTSLLSDCIDMILNKSQRLSKQVSITWYC